MDSDIMSGGQLPIYPPLTSSFGTEVLFAAIIVYDQRDGKKQLASRREKIALDFTHVPELGNTGNHRVAMRHKTSNR
jgi:hypothetical protein